jgi:hypothetical protein
MDWNLVFDGISSIGSAGAFLFAILISRKISFKKDLKKMQLDIVFKLVSDLQNLQLFFLYSFVTPPKENKTMSYTGDIWFYFFDMDKTKIESCFEYKTENPKLAVSMDFLYSGTIFKYAHNPFLPESIAKALINLYPRGGDTIEFTKQTNIIYISDDRAYEKHKYSQEIFRCYSNIDNLFEATDELKKTILVWLKKNGVKELNIRKPINIENYP